MQSQPRTRLCDQSSTSKSEGWYGEQLRTGPGVSPAQLRMAEIGANRYADLRAVGGQHRLIGSGLTSLRSGLQVRRPLLFNAAVFPDDHSKQPGDHEQRDDGVTNEVEVQVRNGD
jgi:hypothetical protein